MLWRIGLRVFATKNNPYGLLAEMRRECCKNAIGPPPHGRGRASAGIRHGFAWSCAGPRIANRLFRAPPARRALFGMTGGGCWFVPRIHPKPSIRPPSSFRPPPARGQASAGIQMWRATRIAAKNWIPDRAADWKRGQSGRTGCRLSGMTGGGCWFIPDESSQPSFPRRRESICDVPHPSPLKTGSRIARQIATTG